MLTVLVSGELARMLHAGTIVDRVILPAIGTRNTTELEGKALDRFSAQLAKTGRSVETQRGTLRVLRRLLSFGVRRGALPKVPAIEMPIDHEAKAKTRRYLTPAEGHALIAAADGDDHALVVVALRVGLRAGELLGLQWRDVDVKAKRLTVARSIDEGEVLTTKSGEERVVPLSGQAVKALKEQRKRHPDSNNVFPLVETRHQVAVVVRRVARAAGLKVRGPHSLRHSMGAAAAASGVPARVLQAWLGHSDPKTTQGYFELPPGAGDSLINRLDVAA